MHIRDNHGLCFVSTVNWTANIMAGSSNTNIALNMDDKTCRRCLPDPPVTLLQSEGTRSAARNAASRVAAGEQGQVGCLKKKLNKAPSEMCVQCASWMLNDTCVSQCPSEGYFEDDETRECKPCYEQCLQCRGSAFSLLFSFLFRSQEVRLYHVQKCLVV